MRRDIFTIRGFSCLSSVFYFYLLDEFRRITADNGHRRHIVCDHTISTNDRTVTDAHTGQNDGTDANPHFIFYHYRATVRGTAVIGIRVVVNGDKVHFRSNEYPVANGNAATVEERASLLNPASLANADVLAVAIVSKTVLISWS